MSSCPKLSIITICRNETHIEATCKSVAEQIFKDFEWLVVDGASTDGTVDILRQYEDRMSFFVSEPDSGRYNAMNKAIAKARGEFVLFLNGGDYLFDAFVLERLFNYQDAVLGQASNSNTESAVLRAMEPQLTADILYGQVVAQETGFMPWPTWSIGPQLVDFHFFRRYNLPHQATFIKRTLFDSVGLYDESYRSAGDYEWFMRAILTHKASTRYIPAIVSVYNFEGVSTSGYDHDSPVFAETIRAQAPYAAKNELDVVPHGDRHLLFGFIPLTCKYGGTSQRVVMRYSLGPIPLFKIVRRDQERTSYYLFGFFPILRKKRCD